MTRVEAAVNKTLQALLCLTVVGLTKYKAILGTKSFLYCNLQCKVNACNLQVNGLAGKRRILKTSHFEHQLGINHDTSVLSHTLNLLLL